MLTNFSLKFKLTKYTLVSVLRKGTKFFLNILFKKNTIQSNKAN